MKIKVQPPRLSLLPPFAVFILAIGVDSLAQSPPYWNAAKLAFNRSVSVVVIAIAISMLCWWFVASRRSRALNPGARPQASNPPGTPGSRQLDADLSEALCAYLGPEQSDRPDLSRIVDAFPGDPGQVLQERVSVLAEALEPLAHVDWSKVRDFAEAANRYEQKVRAAHPELSDAAVARLRMQFAWDWR